MTEIITIVLENRKGRYYVHTKDIEGLFLWGSDKEQLLEDIPTAIEGLYHYNKNQDVKVSLLSNEVNRYVYTVD